jgi:parvulin-like peptidyl-prolyl isomerase
VAHKLAPAVNLVNLVRKMPKAAIGLVVACALSVACGESTPRAAATVNGHTITVKEIDAALTRFVGSTEFATAAQGRDKEAFKREYQQTVLSRLIRREILEGKADEADIEITTDQVDEQLDQLVESVGSQEEFDTELDNRNLTLTEVRGFLRDSLVEEALRAHVVEGLEPSEAELQAFYESNLDQFVEIHTAHILVEAHNRAADISNQLKAASPEEVDALFADLAREFSIDTASAKKGGDLGFVAANQFIPEYSAAALALEEGEISEPVQTEFGWHVVRLLDTSTTPFVDVREQLVGQLGTEQEETAWQDFLVQAYRDADVSLNSRYGELDVETQLVVNADASTIPGAEQPADPSPQQTLQPTPIG